MQLHWSHLVPGTHISPFPNAGKTPRTLAHKLPENALIRMAIEINSVTAVKFVLDGVRW